MEVLILNRDLETIEWIEDVLHDISVNKDIFSPDMMEKLHNAQGFLHRIKTNAKTVKRIHGK